MAIGLRDAVETNLAAKGTGVRGGVTVAMLRYLAENSKRSMVFAVEEPEAFLHPAAQEDLRDDLEALAERRDVTLLVTTHSPYIVSRHPKASLIELKKDMGGRTFCAGAVRGDEHHKSRLGGLFRDAAVPDFVAQADLIPSEARGVVLVEGVTDAAYIELACRLTGCSELIGDLHIEPTAGTKGMAMKAVIFRHLLKDKPLMVVVDNDENGREVVRLLTGEKFNFTRKREITTIADLFEKKDFPYESERTSCLHG